MKRKTFRNIALAITATLCCGMVNVPVVDGAKASPAKTAYDPTYAVVNDFEKIDDLYELAWSGNYDGFGVANLNTDKTYVTSGNSSVKLNPIGNYKANQAPTIVRLLLNRHKEHAASKMTAVSFDIFNASEYDGTISCALAIDGTTTKYLDFAVAKGEHKTIRLEYDLVAMSAAYDINKVEGINVKLPKAIDRETQDKNIWYIDKFCAEYTPFESKGYEMTLGENEFCNFDAIYQEYIVNTNCGTGSIDGFRPEISINTNAYYCSDKDDDNFVFGKNKSLKVVAKAGLSSGGPAFTFSDKLWHNFEWSEMNDKALQFDVYNASESPFTFSLIIFRNPDNYRTDYYDRYSKSFKIPAYSWQTVTLSIKEWNEATENTNGNPMTSYESRGKIIYTYNTPFFAYTGSAVGSQDRTFYFDNFRIVDYVTAE